MIVHKTYLQTKPMDGRLDTKALAVNIAEAVESYHDGSTKARFTITPDLLKLHICSIIPATNRHTTSAQRKRFGKEIDLLLAELGWVPVHPHIRHWIYKKASP